MNKQAGVILLFTLVFMFIMVMVVGALVSYAGIQIQAHRQAVQREIGLSIAEAGAELAIWKLNHQAGYTGETNTTYGAGTYNVVITNLSSSSKVIHVDSYVPNSSAPIAHRIVQMIVGIGTKNIGFNYAVQSGAGGFTLDNGAGIIGNIYSGGPVQGAQTATVTGDATSVSSIKDLNITGNANSDTLETSTVSLNTTQHTSITNSIITGNASTNHFIGASNKCKVFGAATYNTNGGCNLSGGTTSPNNSLPAVPANIGLPIPDQQITDWENEGAGGGTIGSQTINGSVSMGPKKILGDLIVNGTLTLTGTIWVTGSITITNGSTVRLAAAYGALTGILMAGISGSSTAGYINVSNNSTLDGSGTAGSYLLLLSEMNSTSTNAIDITNNAISTIVYAGTGVVNVLNNAQLREITGYRIHLNNNVVLTSTAGSTNAQYSGSSNGWQSTDQTWQLLQ